jgi:hypothetical protein
LAALIFVKAPVRLGPAEEAAPYSDAIALTGLAPIGGAGLDESR